MQFEVDGILAIAFQVVLGNAKRTPLEVRGN
jgi:hypothetical protein